MDRLQGLYEDIRLAPGVTDTILEQVEKLDMVQIRPVLEMLRQEKNWEQGLAEAKRLLGEDPDGYKMLCCMLLCARKCREDYESRGISQKIYVDTMACFSRFVEEHRNSFGRYGFDRGFWTVRQVSGKLFRIGQLEYELTEEDGQKVVSLHIPSDADLSGPELRQSYEDAREFLMRLFPEYAAGPWVCGSWLLSPNLQDMLPESSRILEFQRSFRILRQWQDEDFKEWVYGRTDIPTESLPEKTTLQRELKKFLLMGGTFLSAGGVLVEDPFRG